MSTATAIRMWHRFFKATRLNWRVWPTKLSGLTSPIRAGLKDLGWNEMRDHPWSWKHEGIHAQFSLNPRLQSWCDEGKHLQHLLQESW